MFSFRISLLNQTVLTSYKRASYATILVFAFLLVVDVTFGSIELKKISTLYLAQNPTSTGSFVFPSSAVEDSIYDKEQGMIYTVGGTYLRAIDASDLSHMVEIEHLDVPGSEFNSVHLCGRFIITSVPNIDQRHIGRIIIYDTPSRKNRQFIRRHSITVGPNPSHMAMTRDCKTFVFGIEGEAYLDKFTNTLIDPEGGVGVLHFPKGIGAKSSKKNHDLPYDYIQLNFTKFNARTEELVNQGVRFIYRINNNTLSRDLEPEDVVISDDEKTAYVALQENNAIAILDLKNIKNPDITAILPLGYKNWMDSGLDASDKDGVVNIVPHPIYGMFQPDLIAYKRIAGVPYIFTANEGDGKSYSSGWSEEKRGKDFILDGLITKDAPQGLYSKLNNKRLLGRLEFTLDDGTFNNSGMYNKLYAFGGRSFSIFRADDMKLVYDSGDHIERSHAEKYPLLFNADSKRSTETLEATVDKRSDDKGPECESIRLAEVHNKLLIFVGNERPGTISIYSIVNDNVASPQFESLNYGGEIISGQTWQESYGNRTIGDMDPESLVYVPANENPSGEPILIVAGVVSGTISVYAIRDSDVTGQTNGTNVNSTGVPCFSRPVKNFTHKFVLVFLFSSLLLIFC